MGCATVACDRDGVPGAPSGPGTPPEPPRSASSSGAATGSAAERELVERALARLNAGDDAGAETLPADPPLPPGDFKAEMDGFTTLEACVTAHAKLDPLVGDALRAVGYDTFLRDACRVLEAAKKQSVAPCLEVDSTALKSRCIAITAIVVGNPDLCPDAIASRPKRGRDPTCLAAAARDVRMCTAEEAGKRPTCEAWATGDARRCDANAYPPERAACARDLRRFRSLVVGTKSGGTKPLDTPTATIRVEPVRDFDASPKDPVTLNAASVASKGVAVIVTGDVAKIEFGEAVETGTVTLAPSPSSPPRAAFVVESRSPRGDGKGDAKSTTKVDSVAKVERLEIAIPGDAVLVCPSAKCTFTTTKVEGSLRERGSPVKVSILGDVGPKPKDRHVEVEVSTFVRDVVDVTTPAPSR
ncbi:MAG: hypothetical protein U0169_20675 [Polyangiaceae bacterium]